MTDAAAVDDPVASGPGSDSASAPASAPDAASAPRRPGLVTAALVLLYLGGVASAALGVLVLLSRYRVPPEAVVPVSLLGAAIALAGLLALAVTSAVGRGDRRARLAVTVWIGILAALHVVTVVVSDDFDLTSPIPIVLDAFVLAALWLPSSSRWFRAAHPTD